MPSSDAKKMSSKSLGDTCSDGVNSDSSQNSAAVPMMRQSVSSSGDTLPARINLPSGAPAPHITSAPIMAPWPLILEISITYRTLFFPPAKLAIIHDMPQQIFTNVPRGIFVNKGIKVQCINTLIYFRAFTDGKMGDDGTRRRGRRRPTDSPTGRSDGRLGGVRGRGGCGGRGGRRRRGGRGRRR